MTLPPQSTAYVREIVSAARRQFLVPRFFKAAEDWEKWSVHGWRGYRFGHDPSLETVLQRQRVVVLGEPGSGKSTLLDAAVGACTENGWLPVRLWLREYQGSLAALIDAALPAHVRAEISAAPDAIKAFLIDGFDEVPLAQSAAFVRDLSELEQAEPNARIVMTSRQAFYVNRRKDFPSEYPAYYILDLDDDDIDALLAANGVDRDGFVKAAAEAGLSDELANPFVLQTVTALYKAKGSLGQTRSEAVKFVVEETLQSRPTLYAKREMQALRMLALAMEIAARNELSVDEARRVLTAALGVSLEQASALLDDLSQSILLRTKGGYVFQMRSFGECLAAFELAEARDRDRWLEPMFLAGSRNLHDSWRNVVSYLAELSRHARRYFAAKQPEWLLRSSLSAFSEPEKVSIASAVMEQMKRGREFLSYHPLVRATDLARFVPPSFAEELVKIARQSEDEVERANAILVVGLAGREEFRDDALRLALDPKQSVHVRRSALASLHGIGRADSIPRLLDIDDWSESTVPARLDAAAELADAANLPLVLGALARTQTVVSSAFRRVREMSKGNDLGDMLTAVAALPPEHLTRRVGGYLEKLWDAVAEKWKPEWAPEVARIILTTEGDADSNVADALASALAKRDDRAAPVGRRLLEAVANDDAGLRGYRRAVAALVRLDDLKWFEGKSANPELELYLRAYGSEDVRAYLFEKIPPAGVPPEHQLKVDRWELRRQAAERRTERYQGSARSSTAGGEILKALARLDPDQWPPLGTGQLSALSESVDQMMSTLDLRNRIVSEDDNRWTIPQVLPLLLRAIDRYEIQLAQDAPLVQTLRAHEGPLVSRYRKRFGFSAAAISELEALASERTLGDGELEGILRFLRDSPIESSKVIAFVEATLTGQRNDNVRSDALVALAGSDAGREVIARNVRALTGDLSARAERILVEHGHRPTAERLLSALLGDPTRIRAANVEDHFHHPLGWIRAIRHPGTWPKLERLRGFAISAGLWHVASAATAAMAGMDAVRLSEVIRRQAPTAPEEWQPFELARALEYERDGKIRAAQNATFEQILERLRAFSTMMLFKVWTEGPSDVQALEALIAKGGITPGTVLVQSIGGWGQILPDSWSPRGLGTGCSDFAVWLDGDRARDWTDPQHPVKAQDQEVKKAIRKLEAMDVEFHILERYALENYFPPYAFQKVLKKVVTVRPIAPDRSVLSQVKGYSKALNKRLADATDFRDIERTDLGALIVDLRERVSD